MKDKKWIEKATKNKGAMHRNLGVPKGEKIPATKIAKEIKSKNPKIKAEANLAKTLSKMSNNVGRKWHT